jgi:DNA gyrase subunit A
VRARTHFEDVGKGDRQAIIITELPYQVNKARLLERIADLVREKLIDGIASDGCATSPTRTACASSSS